MAKDEQPIYMDKEGYAEFLKSIEDLKDKIVKNDMDRSAAFNAGAGDGWDSPEYEEIERISRGLNLELQEKYEMQSRIVLVEKNEDENLIGIGDVLSADINNKEMIFKLVGGVASFSAEIREVTINSPIGKAVYKKKVGDICEYDVNGKKFTLVINKKIDLTKDDKPKEKTK